MNFYTAPILGQGIQQQTMMQTGNTVQSNAKLTPAGNVFDIPQQQMWQQPIAVVQPSKASPIQVSSSPGRSETRK